MIRAWVDSRGHLRLWASILVGNRSALGIEVGSRESLVRRAQARSNPMVKDDLLRRAGDGWHEGRGFRR